LKSWISNEALNDGGAFFRESVEPIPEKRSGLSAARAALAAKTVGGRAGIRLRKKVPRRVLPLLPEVAEEAELGGFDFGHIAAGVERAHQETTENQAQEKARNGVVGRGGG
jgi:hypothetical protein